ncbi:LysR substrate-binding domain-containing protein [Pendulispora albinea]|uniref:LysR substrate-binding domain-containing protein n=1 Tax=Pendulispora albinea TaxID=2741071 RepID=A0ABZ2M6E0_9BACT
MLLRPPPLPPLSAIRVFEAAARHESFTRAAEELGMTQAAVSYQIKLLEQELGMPLFQRLPRKVVLTATGKRLASPVVEAFTILRAAFADTSERAEGELSISTLPTFASKWLVHRLGTFQLRNPKLAVRLDTSIGLVDLTGGAFDVSVRLGSGEWPGLASHFLLPNAYTPLLGPKLLRTLGPHPKPLDLLKLSLLGRTAWWIRWFAEAGVEGVDLSGRVELALYQEQFDVTAAIEGHGVALASPLFFAREIEAGLLVHPFGPVVRDRNAYWVAYPEFRRRSEKIRTFVSWILGEAKADPALEALGPRKK